MLPNPTLGYTNDQGRSSNLSNEKTWVLSQSFDLSGRRGLRREAAELRVEAAYSGNRLRHAEWATEIPSSLPRNPVQTGRRSCDQEAGAALQTSRRLKLAKAGEASGYDRRRLAQGVQNAELRLTASKVTWTVLRSALAPDWHPGRRAR